MSLKVKLDKVGADVEGFFLNPNTGYPFPCVGVFKGTKEKPQPITTLGDGFAIQEDNVMPEYNIPPAKSAEDFASSILAVHIWLHDFARSRFKCDLATYGALVFKPEDLKSEQALKFGCDPDFCVWSRSVNPTPTSKKPTLRTAGGHVHVSYTIDGQMPKNHPKQLDVLEHLVKAHDLYLGIPSLFSDDDSVRKEMYGKAGAFRPKDYGHEYRVLSPYWTRNHHYSTWVFEQVERSIDSIEKGLKFDPKLGNAIQKAINTRNMKIAVNLVKNFDLTLIQ